MKNIIPSNNYILILVIIVSATFILSCHKDKDPKLSIFVSAKKSEKYTSIAMHHGTIRFLDNSNGTKGISSIQSYDGLDIYMDLSNENYKILVADEPHWEQNIQGIQATLSNIVLNDLLENQFRLEPKKDFSKKFYDCNFEIHKNESYRIDFIYDIDSSIITTDASIVFNPVVEIKVTRM